MNSQQHTDLQKYPLQSGAQGFPGGASGNPPANAEGAEDIRSLGWDHPLEKGMATHSSILACRIPWTEESGGLQSMGSQSQT